MGTSYHLRCGMLITYFSIDKGRETEVYRVRSESRKYHELCPTALYHQQESPFLPIENLDGLIFMYLN